MPNLPATEWSLRVDGQPPESLVPIVSQVVGFVRGLARPTHTSGVAAPDRPRVVTILGDRGVGKSTALAFALRDLEEQSACFVLPTIDPEGFAKGDSLAGWVLAHLQHSLSDSERGAVTAQGKTLGGEVEELSRIQAIRSSGFVPGLEHRGLTFEDFSRDAIKVPYRNVEVGKLWSTVIENLAMVRGRDDLQVIVPIDDADLAPQLLPSIVNDAQLLGASPRVAIVFAAADTTLRQSLEVGLVASHGGVAGAALQYGLLSTAEVRSLVERRLVKSFPRSLRVRLDPLDLEARLDFRPLTFEKTITDLLAGFTVSLPGYDTLADFFYIRSASGERLEPSEYAVALSDNPRDLRQIHEALAAIDTDGAQAASEAMAIVLGHGMETVRDSLPPALPPDPWSVRHRGGHPSLDFTLDQLEFGRTTAMGLAIYRPKDDPKAENDLLLGDPIYARRESGHYTRFRPPEDEQRSGDEETTSLLNPQFSYLTFLAWECIQENAHGDSLIERGSVDRAIVLPGGNRWTREIYALGEDENWAYWTVPDWDSYSDYFVFGSGWGRVQRLARDIDLEPGDARFVEFLLVAHVRLVLAAQTDRRIPDDLANITLDGAKDILESWATKGRQEGLALIRAGVEAVYRSRLVVTSVREQDFTFWFDSLFPLMASRLCSGPELSDGLLEIWSSTVDPAHQDVVIQRLSDIAVRHLQMNLGEADLELLSRIDAARAAELADVRRQLLIAASETSASVLAKLERAAVPPRILEGIREFGATRDVLIALVAQGISTDLIAGVVEAFPPRSPASEDSPDQRSTGRHGPE